jgi:choline-glycine betaine transporter
MRKSEALGGTKSGLRLLSAAAMLLGLALAVSACTYPTYPVTTRTTTTEQTSQDLAPPPMSTTTTRTQQYTP